MLIYSKEEGLEINFISCGAEEIPLPDNYFDSVLITYTMCTIPEVIRANIEIKRVLKDGGKLIFCEHGIAPDLQVNILLIVKLNLFWALLKAVSKQKNCGQSALN